MKNNSLKYHITLANYFHSKPIYWVGEEFKKPNIRKLAEQPWQQTRSKKWNNVTETLCNLIFIEAKCASGMVYKLLEDYNYAIKLFPESIEDRNEQIYEQHLEKYIKKVISFSKGTLKQLDCISSYKPWSKEEIENRSKLTVKKNRVIRLKAFAYFVLNESNNLERFGKLDGFCLQQAYNTNYSDIVSASAKKWLEFNITSILLLTKQQNSVSFNSHPAIVSQIWAFNERFPQINDLFMTMDGIIAAGTIKDEIYIWKLESGECINLIRNPSSLYSPTKIVISADKSKLVIYEIQEDFFGSKDIDYWKQQEQEELNLSDEESPRKNEILESIRGSISDIESPERKLRLIWVYNWKEKKLKRIIETHYGHIYAMSVSFDGRLAVCLSINCINNYQTLHGWDLETGKCEFKFNVLTELCNNPSQDIFLKSYHASTHALSLTMDGKFAVSSSFEKVIRIWNLKSGECYTLKGHKDEVIDTSLTPDGKCVVSLSLDNTLRIWDLDKKTCSMVLNLNKEQNFIPKINITHDGKYIIAGRWPDEIQVWDIQNTKCIKTLKQYNTNFGSLQITADGRRAILFNIEKGIQIWDIHRGYLTDRLTNYAISTDLYISNNYKTIVSATWDGYLLVWDLISLKFTKYIKAHDAKIEKIAVKTSNERIVISGGGDLDNPDYALRIWNIESNVKIKTLNGHTGGIISILITLDNSQIISASKDGTIRIWDSETGQEIKILKHHFERTYSGKLILTPDSRLLILSWEFSEFRTWDLMTDFSPFGITHWNSKYPQLITTIPGWDKWYTQEFITITPDGKLITNDRGTLYIVDIQSGKLLKTIEISLKEIYYNIFFYCTPDGQRGIFYENTTQNYTIKIINLKTGDISRTLFGHFGKIIKINITPDGNYLFTASLDRTIRLWDLLTGKCLSIASFPQTIDQMTFYGDVLTIASDQGITAFRIKNIEFSPPIVTAVRIYKNSDNLWDKQISSECYWCKERFSINDKLLSIIKYIKQRTNLLEYQSPCLNLPDEAWNNTNLLSKCPSCHKPLKFNPFIVDNMDRYKY